MTYYLGGYIISPELTVKIVEHITGEPCPSSPKFNNLVLNRWIRATKAKIPQLRALSYPERYNADHYTFIMPLVDGRRPKNFMFEENEEHRELKRKLLEHFPVDVTDEDIVWITAEY
jgi:hypothetical protein